MRYVDLSHQLTAGTPVYPGDPQFRAVPHAVPDREGYTNHHVSLGTHSGTHIDAPAHMLASGMTVGALPLTAFTGSGVVIDVRQGMDKATLARQVARGSAVVLWTGMSEHYDNPAYFSNYQDLDESFARALIKRQIALLAIDACSVDHAPFPIHKLLLGAGIPIIENITNISAVAGKPFRLYAFPANVQLDGWPVRVVAELNA